MLSAFNKEATAWSVYDLRRYLSSHVEATGGLPKNQAERDMKLLQQSSGKGMARFKQKFLNDS
jgi:hypothetical protein